MADGTIAINANSPATPPVHTDHVTLGGVAGDIERVKEYVGWGRTAPVVPMAVTTAAAYAVGNTLGAKISFANVFRAAGRGALLEQVLITDKAGVLAAATAKLALVLFNGDFTAVADKTAFSLSVAADWTKRLGAVLVTFQQIGTPGIGSVVGKDLAELRMPLIGAGTSLYGQLVIVAGTPTFAAADDVTVDLIFRQD